jgi:hypothetical protein
MAENILLLLEGHSQGHQERAERLLHIINADKSKHRAGARYSLGSTRPLVVFPETSRHA